MTTTFHPAPDSGTYAPLGLREGYWYVGGDGGNPTTAIRPEAQLEATPFLMPVDGSLDRIAVEVTTVGTSGAVIRLGIYDAAADGTPGNLVLDAGTVSGTSTGVKEVTISPSLDRGWYFLAAAVQGAAGTRPTTRTMATGGRQVGHAAVATIFTFPARGYFQTGVTGALPASFTLGGGTRDTHVVAVRIGPFS